MDEATPDIPIDVLPFNEAFHRSKAGPISYKGNIVHMAFRIQIEAQTRLWIDILKRRSPPEQALHLVADGCEIVIRQKASCKGLIWVSEWLEPIEISFLNVKEGARFMMWNATSSEIGLSTNDWGNYGLVIEQASPGREWILRCSQGMMPQLPDFDALVLRVTAEPHAEFIVQP